MDYTTQQALANILGEAQAYDEAKNTADKANRPGFVRARTVDEAVASPEMVSLGRLLAHDAGLRGTDEPMGQRETVEGPIEGHEPRTPQQLGQMGFDHLRSMIQMPVLVANANRAINDQDFAKSLTAALNVYDGNPETGDKGTERSLSGFVHGLGYALTDPINLIPFGGTEASAGQKAAAVASTGVRGAFLRALTAQGSKGVAARVATQGALIGSLSGMQQSATDTIKAAAGELPNQGDFLETAKAEAGAVAKSTAMGTAMGAALGTVGHGIGAGFEVARQQNAYMRDLVEAVRGAPSNHVFDGQNPAATELVHAAEAARAVDAGAKPEYDAVRKIAEEVGLPHLGVEFVTKAEALSANPNAQAKYVNGMITLLKSAEDPTITREAFHEVVHAAVENGFFPESEMARYTQHPSVQEALKPNSELRVALQEDANLRLRDELKDPNAVAPTVSDSFVREEAVADVMKNEAMIRTTDASLRPTGGTTKWWRAFVGEDVRKPEDITKDFLSGRTGKRVKEIRLKDLENSPAFRNSGFVPDETTLAAQGRYAHLDSAATPWGEADKYIGHINDAMDIMRDHDPEALAAFTKLHSEDLETLRVARQNQNLREVNDSLNRIYGKSNAAIDAAVSDEARFTPQGTPRAKPVVGDERFMPSVEDTAVAETRAKTAADVAETERIKAATTNLDAQVEEARKQAAAQQQEAIRQQNLARQVEVDAGAAKYSAEAKSRQAVETEKQRAIDRSARITKVRKGLRNSGQSEADAAANAEVQVAAEDGYLALIDRVSKMKRGDAFVQDSRVAVAHLEGALERKDYPNANAILRWLNSQADAVSDHGEPRYSIKLPSQRVAEVARQKAALESVGLNTTPMAEGKNTVPGSKGYDTGQVHTANMAYMIPGTKAVDWAAVHGTSDMVNLAQRLMDNDVQIAAWDSVSQSSRRMSMAEIRARSHEMGIDEIMASVKDTGGRLAPEMMRMRDLFAGSYEDALTKINLAKMKTSTPGQLLAAEEAIARTQMALGMLTDRAADIGRAQRVMQEIPRQKDKLMAMAALMRGEAGETLRTRFAAMADIATDQKAPGVLAFANRTNAQMAQDSILYIFRNALLSGFKSVARTGVSNVLQVPFYMVEKALSGVISAVPGIGSGQTPMSEVVAAVRSFHSGKMDAIRNGWRVVTNKVAPTPGVGLGTDVYYHASPLLESARRLDNSTNETLQAFGSVLRAVDPAVSLPGRIQGGLDTATKGMIDQMLLESICHRLAVNNAKGDVNKFAELFAQYKGDPGKLLPDGTRILDLVKHESSDLMLHGDMTLFGRTLQSMTLECPPLAFITPFIRVADNEFRFVGTRNPLTAAFFDRFRQDMAAGGAARDKALAGLTVGSTMLAGLWGMYTMGEVTGGVPHDPAEKLQWDLAGKQPYSFRCGGKWIRFDSLGPAGKLIGSTVDSLHLIHRTWDGGLHNQQAWEAGYSALAGLANVAMDKNALSPVSAMFDASSKSDANAIGRVFNSLAGSLSPAIVNDVAKLLDPYQREANGMIETLQSRLPGLSKDLPMRYDIFGQVKEHGSDQSVPPWYDMALPFAVTSAEPKFSAQKEIVQQAFNIPRLGAQISVNGLKIDTSKIPGAFAQYAGLTGSVRLPYYGNKTLPETLSALVDGKTPLSAQYAAAPGGPNSAKEKMINQIIQLYRHEAAKHLVSNNPGMAAEYQVQLKAFQQARATYAAIGVPFQ